MLATHAPAFALEAESSVVDGAVSVMGLFVETSGPADPELGSCCNTFKQSSASCSFVFFLAPFFC